MADETLLEKVRDLSDLELALLLCLISREHCLISTPPEAVDYLVQELQLISLKTYSLQPVVIACTPSTTLDDFVASLFPDGPREHRPPSTSSRDSRGQAAAQGSYFSSHPAKSAAPGFFSATTTTTTTTNIVPPISPFHATANSRIANVVIVKDLDRASHAVQIQALELLRTRRIFTRTSVQVAPKPFVFVPVLQTDGWRRQAKVTRHLNDFFYIGHWHDPEDGFVNLEEQEEDRDNASLTADKPLISETDISHLAKLSSQVRIDIDVTRYQMDIISHLRMHRAVDSGISPLATRHLGQLMRCLAPLHGLEYVTPALVGLAARKIYLHRVELTAPDKERSMQWGSRLEAVRALLRDVGPEQVIEDVLSMVPAPL